MKNTDNGKWLVVRICIGRRRVFYWGTQNCLYPTRS